MLGDGEGGVTDSAIRTETTVQIIVCVCVQNTGFRASERVQILCV